MSKVFEEYLAALGVDNDAMDQVGTLLVALLVGVLGTLSRVAVIRKNRWWFNMIMFHGAITVYWWNNCHLNQAANPWLQTIHGGLCWKGTDGKFQQIAFWGGDRERLWTNVLVWLAVLGNVVPAYAKGNEAGRHMTHVKKRACNPLINHIIAGILCVCFPYFVWLFHGEKVMMLIAICFDIYHQITIHRLIANHDGIWVLRACSMSLAITKWIVILNMYTTDPWNMLDQIFILSTGFLGTRAYGALAFIAYYCGLGDIKSAEWYSIGLMTADVMIMGRMWGQMRVAFWLTIVNCAAMHYHQMWKKWIHLRPHFVGMAAITTVIVCHAGVIASLLFTIVYCFSYFMLPHFNRLRPAPPTLYTPTVTPAYKMIKNISGTLSARLKKLSARGSRRSGFSLSTLNRDVSRKFLDSQLSIHKMDRCLSTRSNCSTISEMAPLKTPRDSLTMNASRRNLLNSWTTEETETTDFETEYECPKGSRTNLIPEAPLWKMQRHTSGLSGQEQKALAKEMKELRAKIKELEANMSSPQLSPKDEKEDSNPEVRTEEPLCRTYQDLSIPNNLMIKARVSREQSLEYEASASLARSPRSS